MPDLPGDAVRPVRRRARQLSGGEQRRVSFARAPVLAAIKATAIHLIRR